MKLKPQPEFAEAPSVEVMVKERTKVFLQLPKTQQEVLLEAAVQYATLNEQEKLLKARRDTQYRPLIEGVTDDYGIEDTNGHKHMVMSDEVEVVREKKVTRTLNPIVAESILRDNELWEQCLQEVVTYEIDEEKIMQAYTAGLISAEELDRMFDEKIGWATKVNTTDEQVVAIRELRKAIEKGKPTGELPTIESSR